MTTKSKFKKGERVFFHYDPGWQKAHDFSRGMNATK
jgi:hypothetical protein